MRVTILEEHSGSIIIDGTTLDFGDQGYVSLDTDELKDNTDYVLRYDLYDTQLHSASASDDEAAFAQRSMTNVRCKHPFITQELMVVDRRLLKHRIAEANQFADKAKDFSVSGLRNCDFQSINNSYDSSSFQESMYCQESLYLPMNLETLDSTYSSSR